MTFAQFSPALRVNDLLRESPAADAAAAAAVGLPLTELLAALPEPTEAA